MHDFRVLTMPHAIQQCCGRQMTHLAQRLRIQSASQAIGYGWVELSRAGWTAGAHASRAKRCARRAQRTKTGAQAAGGTIMRGVGGCGGSRGIGGIGECGPSRQAVALSEYR